MKSPKNSLNDPNCVAISLTDFRNYYNENIPKTFPQATHDNLKKFQESYPSLFSKNDEWTIDKHRKRLMDWLASNPTQTTNSAS